MFKKNIGREGQIHLGRLKRLLNNLRVRGGERNTEFIFDSLPNDPITTEIQKGQLPLYEERHKVAFSYLQFIFQKGKGERIIRRCSKI